MNSVKYNGRMHDARYELVEIGPQMAQVLLEKNYNKNRKPTMAVVNKYAEFMRSGKWIDGNPQPIIICNGVLVDGQQRLMAVEKSGAKIVFNVCYCNVEPERYFDFIDSGKPRMLYDRVSLHDKAYVNKVIIALMNFAVWLRRAGVHMLVIDSGSIARWSITPENARDMFDCYRESLIFVAENKRHDKLVGLIPIIFAIAELHYFDQEKGSAFMLDWNNNVQQNIQQCQALRNWGIRNHERRDRINLYKAAVYCCGKYLMDEEISRVSLVTWAMFFDSSYELKGR